MEDSRVQKYKEYRSSMIKDDSPVLESTPVETTKTDSNNRNTTSTLPIDQVMESLNNDVDESFDKKAKRKRIIIIAAIITGLVLLTIALVVIGMIIWR